MTDKNKETKEALKKAIAALEKDGVLPLVRQTPPVVESAGEVKDPDLEKFLENKDPTKID